MSPLHITPVERGKTGRALLFVLRGYIPGGLSDKLDRDISRWKMDNSAGVVGGADAAQRDLTLQGAA